MFTWHREFVTTSFSKCNRPFQVHFPEVEGERRDAFPLRSERTQKRLNKKINSRSFVQYMFRVIEETVLNQI